MKQTEASRATIGRIPLYLRYLKNKPHTAKNISATTLARELGLGEVQVRKDLGIASGAGRPKTGYNIEELISALEGFLNRDEENSVVIVGAGKLGRALLDYGGFKEYGLEIVAAFDTAVQGTERTAQGKPIYSMEFFESYCKAHRVKIGVIAVPAAAAQEVCDLLVKNGIRAVWCFAPCVLSLPKEIPVQYENMALSLAYLNQKVFCD